MPKNKAPARIGIHELVFSGFEIPMEHRETVFNTESIKIVKVYPVEYHIVKTFNPAKGRIEYKAVIPLNHKHRLNRDFDKLRGLFEEAGIDYEFAEDGNVRYLILTVPEEAELIDFVKRVEEKVTEFEKLSANDVFHVGVAKDEIYIDKTNDAPIVVKKTYIPSNDEFVAFVLNTLEMPKFWFKVKEHAVVLGDYKAISFRFLHAKKQEEKLESNRIIVSYTVPAGDDPLSEIIKLRIENDIEKLKKHDEFYRELTRSWVIRAVNKYTPEIKTEIMDVIDEMLEKKALKVIASKEYSNSFHVEVITPDGKLYAEDFIPDFVLKKIVKTYYDNLLFQLLRIYISEARELLSRTPDIESVTEEEKKSFLENLLRKFRKVDKEPKQEEKELPEYEGDIFIAVARDYVEEK